MNDSDSSGAIEAGSSNDDKDRKIASSSLSATAASGVNDAANNNDINVMIGNGFHSVVGLKPPAAVQSISAAATKTTAAAAIMKDDNREEEKQSSSPIRGRQLHRKNHQDDNNNIIRSPSAENGFVPLKVIHVPNKITTTTNAPSSSNNNSRIDATKRAPSVPDLTSLHHPPLSDIILKTKQRYDGLQDDDQREQLLEERLRRAHLRLSSDVNNNNNAQQHQRYRSKSTPSRGGWGRRRYESDEQQLEGQCREEHQEQQQEQIGDDVRVTDRSPPIGLAQGNNTVLHNTTAAATATSGSVKSLDVSVAPGSHHSDDLLLEDMVEPPPPPPPPPITERERLVERERQARMEMERARHRQKMALQRERQLEDDESGDDDDENINDHDDGHSFDNEGSGEDDDHRNHHAALTGDISFEERDDDGIPSPPIPPPPATEKERLVERERQARLETERARRRHLAFQREEQEQQEHLEIEEHNNVRDENNDSHGNNGYLDAALENNYLRDIDDTPLLDTLPDTFVSPMAASRGNSERSREVSTESVVSSDSGHGSRGGAKAVVQNTEAEAANNLSYPMERFLETLGDETANAPSDDMPPEVENDESSLPYTMELFLAENAAGVSGGDNPPVLETAMGHLSDSNILASSTALVLPQPPSSALSTGGMTDPFVNEHVATSDFVGELAGLATGSHVHSDELDGEPLQDNDSALLSEQHSHSSSTSRRLLNLSADSLVNSSAESPELTSRPSRPITEADIAQLAEVEHASIGNAAPMSERDEPSVGSIPRRPLLDQAFSVATQTTIIDSVTETTSVGHSRQVSEANQSIVGSSTIIRVGGSIETDASDGASSASIEAVLSIVSAEDEDNDSHLMINPSSTTRSESQSQSVADDSNLSPEINLRMPELTEADVVAMAEIDYASIGNAPPHSVRDERLSESSLTDRGGRQFSVATPISEMDSIDENSILRSLPFRSNIDEDSESSVVSLHQQNDRIPLSNESENTSVEVMPSERSDNSASHNSIEVMLSEHDDDSIDGRSSVADNDDMLTSASIEVSPSVDLENNIAVDEIRDRLDMYGATSDVDTAGETYGTLALKNRLRQYDQDEESAPLISPRLNSSNADSNHYELEKSPRSLGK